MTITCEDKLSGLFSELVSACLEYAGRGISDVFIYASLEGGYFFDPFFAAGGEVIERHKLSGVDTSEARQDSLLEYGARQLIRFAKECAAQGHPTPTQIKLHYVVATGATDADLAYEPQHSTSATLSPHEIGEAWMEDIRRTLSSQGAS